MATFRTVAALLLLAAAGAKAQQQPPPEAGVMPLITRAMADYPRKESSVLTVDYPPGAVDPVYRHNAHAFVYVLEGSIVMGMRGDQPVTLTPSQTDYEDPAGVHTIVHNASQTEPAKFLGVLLRNSGDPVVKLAQ